MKKIIKNIAAVAVLILFILPLQAQFISSSYGSSNKENNQVESISNRQQDIILLEQKAKTMEQDFRSRNIDVFNNHKSGVLQIMDREISRSAYDFIDLKNDLKPVDPDSQEGRALRIAIMQMEDRVNKQKYIRSKVNAFTIDKINVDNTKELSGLRAQYFQFIDSMKVNLRSFEGETPSTTKGDTKTGSSNSTSTGAGTNVFVTTSSASKDKNEKERTESYYRSKDKKAGESYLRTKNNTATALSGTAREMEAAINQDMTQETSKLQQDVMERMESDIALDKKIVQQLENGELTYSGLNASLIKHNFSKKEGLLDTVKTVKLPGQKSQFFSLMDEYIQLLK